MTFSTILGVTEILCSFRLVLEGKTDKKIPESSRLEFLIKCRRQPLNRRYSRFIFVKNTIGNSPKVPRVKFLGSDGLFCFISISKFGSLKNPLAKIASLPELYFKFRCILLVQTKKVISMDYGSCTSR